MGSSPNQPKKRSEKRSKNQQKRNIQPMANSPSDQDYDIYSAALEMTRKAILLLDELLPKVIDQNIHDDLEAELLSIERERLELTQRFRAYEANPAGITPPDAAALKNVTDLSSQVDAANADQAQAQGVLTLTEDVADTASKLFT
jgi:hypothetical protein